MSLIDALILPRWIIPVEPENIQYENYALAVHEGKIIALLPKDEALKKYQAKEEISLEEHVVMPGFVNTHTHSPMTLFRGLSDDIALMDWLNHYIWPAEAKWLSDEFCYDGTRLALLEMIRSGTTCFNDNYFFLEGIFRAASEAKIRATLGLCVLDFANAFAKTPDEYLEKAQKTYELINHHELINFSIAPHAPYTVSDETFLKIKAFSEKNNVVIHVHLQETADEMQKSPIRPVKRLHDLGILSFRTQAIHMTQVNDEDIRLLSKTGTHVVHCPESNLKLASGFCPVQKLVDAGVNVALGTDGACSNNDLDMMNEMKTAAILAKAVSQNPLSINANQAIKMATLNGAKAMGLDNIIGSLKPGKSADMIAIDLSSPNTQPAYHSASQIVYAANSRQVSDVWVAGKQLLKKGQFVYLDEKEIIQKAKVWQKKIIT